MTRHLVATGCDFAHFGLAEDLVESIRAVAQIEYMLGFVRFCATPLPETIASRVDLIADGSERYPAFDPKSGYYCGFAAIKARLPKLFPGFDVYTWIDADCWLQNDVTLRRVERASRHFEVAIHPECDIHYFRFPTPNRRTLMIYSRAMPKDIDRRFLVKPMVNAGVVSARRDSRIWSMWEAALAALAARVDRGESSYYCDQIPLHHLIHSNDITVYPLRATDNWQVYAAQPRIDWREGKLTSPTVPFQEISVIHLAGWTKGLRLTLRTGETVRLRRRELLPALAHLDAWDKELEGPQNNREK